MGQEFEDTLRDRVAALRQARVEAADREDAWTVAVYTVDLEELERLAREHDIDLAAGQQQAVQD